MLPGQWWAVSVAVEVVVGYRPLGRERLRGVLYFPFSPASDVVMPGGLVFGNFKFSGFSSRKGGWAVSERLGVRHCFCDRVPS